MIFPLTENVDKNPLKEAGYPTHELMIRIVGSIPQYAGRRNC